MRESQVGLTWGCMFELEPSDPHKALFQSRTLVVTCLCNVILRFRKSSLTVKSDCSAFNISPLVVIVLAAD